MVESPVRRFELLGWSQGSKEKRLLGAVKEFGGVVQERGFRDGVSGAPPIITPAIQVLVICAKLESMKGSRMCSDGSGCSIIIVIARRVLGPHSLECGRKVCALQFIHFDDSGKNSQFVFDNMVLISCSVSLLFRSSEYKK